MDDPVNGAVLSGMVYVFIVRLPVIVGEEVLVDDGVDIDMLWWFDRGSDEVGFVVFGISGEREE